MALRDLKRVGSAKDDLFKGQENTMEFVRQLNKTMLDGVLLTQIRDSNGRLVSIDIETSTTLVPHGLGRKFVGWHIIDILGDARVWRDDSVIKDRDKFLALKASAAVTVSLWVF